MNQEVEMNVLNIDGKDYFLMDCLVGKNAYYYFSNIKDANDIVVLKEQGDNFVSLGSQMELDAAFSLFYEKYKDKVEENN